MVGGTIVIIVWTLVIAALTAVTVVITALLLAVLSIAPLAESVVEAPLVLTIAIAPLLRAILAVASLIVGVVVAGLIAARRPVGFTVRCCVLAAAEINSLKSLCVLDGIAVVGTTTHGYAWSFRFLVVSLHVRMSKKKFRVAIKA